MTTEYRFKDIVYRIFITSTAANWLNVLLQNNIRKKIIMNGQVFRQMEASDWDIVADIYKHPLVRLPFCFIITRL